MSADTASTTGMGGFLSDKARPARVSAFTASTTMGWRAMLKIKHVPFQMFDVTIMPIMFTVLFMFIFGGAISGSPAEYIQYLLPGIMVQTIVFITVYTGVGLNTDIQKGLFDRFRSMPMWQPAPIVGALLGDLFRYSIAALMVLIVGLILGFEPRGGPLGVVLAFALVLFFASAVSWIWIIIGLKVKKPESVMTTSFIFLMPLTFASDIFVPLDTMPSWLQVIVGNNPVSLLAAASRGLMHGEVVLMDVAWVLGASVLITAVFAPIAMWLYHRER